MNKKAFSFSYKYSTEEDFSMFSVNRLVPDHLKHFVVVSPRVNFGCLSEKIRNC